MAADLGQGVVFAPIQAETQCQHFAFLFIEMAQPTAELLLVNPPLHQVKGFLAAAVGDQVAKVTAAFVGVDRSIQAGGGERLAQQGIQLFDGHGDGFGDFLAAGHCPKFVGQFQAHLADRAKPLAQMHRQTDRSRLAGDCPGHALADPPEGIGRKFIAPGGIKFLDRPL